ncbi:MAG: bifunctional 2-keto-4-hydroxyglutarate aldolase/2-keto-3-deoxy-6-phosphogluconate aldolase [Planctomycetes bacterium]|nr:bifunctional 2-keto-4-hydroxyglutarate aldolase/2-keto-3-deoxy-6-phosphogluconate aldolase [Planctomycetota bacterium]
MSKPTILDRLLESGIVAILRAPDGNKLADVAEALYAGGVTGIEVTFTVPQAHRVLEQVASRLGDKITLGAGTVLDTETARIAILSGAQFIVTPVVRPEVITMCRRYDKPIMPGAMTPTEILTAWEAGADVVKVFPCDSLGPSYVKNIRGPLPQVRLMPTGGVTLENIGAFIKAGACAVGVGSSMVEADAIARGDFKRIETVAREYVDAVRSARG